jgi:gliding motility-associated-like protein/uncharacterized repeat protein (TIGR01451 family)
MVLVDQNPELTIIKLVDKPFYNQIGDQLLYSIKIKNEGNITLYQIKILDDLTEEVWTVVKLSPGEVKEFFTSIIIKEHHLENGIINNTARAEFNFKEVSYSNYSNALSSYQKSRNSIEANLDNFQQNEVNGLLGGLAGNVLGNDLINGRPVNSTDVLITVKDDGGIQRVVIDKEGNLIVPKGTLPGTYVLTYTICDVLDPSNCDDAIAIIEVFHGVNLRISKEVIGTEWFEGDEFEYVLTVENNGNTLATEVLVVDELPTGMRYVTSSLIGAIGTTTINGQALTWKVAQLEIGQQFQVRLRVKLASNIEGNDRTILNTAKVSSQERELSVADNTSTASILAKSFFIPNTITPNGNGFNDSFVIPGLGKFTSNELVIFNRWGDHVYEVKDYQNNWNSEGMVAGTYFYVLKGTDEQGIQYVFKGYIQVIKDGNLR